MVGGRVRYNCVCVCVCVCVRVRVQVARVCFVNCNRLHLKMSRVKNRPNWKLGYKNSVSAMLEFLCNYIYFLPSTFVCHALKISLSLTRRVSKYSRNRENKISEIRNRGFVCDFCKQQQRLVIPSELDVDLVPLSGCAKRTSCL